MDSDFEQENEIPEQQEQQEQQEPNQQQQKPEQANQEIPAETIEIPKQPVLNYLKPQESKYWRFTFKNEANTNKFKSTIESIPEYGLTVEFKTAQETPDVIIKQGATTVGKINLLLCDRRDANLPEKYYCKLYFYQFRNPELYEAVKGHVLGFFDGFKQNRTANKNRVPEKDVGGRRNKKNRTNKRVVNKRLRKRTTRRR